MRQSYIIEIDGVFVGVAASYGSGYTFKGVDSRLKDLDGKHFAQLCDVRAAASRAYRRAPYVARAQAMSLESLPTV